jgi:multidrug resistance efflux pump
MKKTIAAFFNKPVLVVVVSLVIALVIGSVGYSRIHTAPMHSYATAIAGTITTAGAGSAAMQDLTLGFVTGGKIGMVSVKAGDKVKGGKVLASLDAGNVSGSLTQARAAYAAAMANYQKVINGATGVAIDVAKAAVNTAQVNLDQATSQQTLLVANAHRTLLNSTLIAESASGLSTLAAPVVSGTYTGTAEGTLTIVEHQTGGGSSGYFTLSGLATTTGGLSFTGPTPLADTGLSITFPNSNAYEGTSWTITIPNRNAPNYLANYNAYQQALATQSQVLAAANASLSQAQASLTATATAARPEDVASAQAAVENAQGSVQIAEGAYKNTVIIAPGAGTVTSVSITPGQIAIPNAPAIELYATSVQKSVAVMAPKSAVVTRSGKSYVEKKSGNGTVVTEVTLGVSDGTNVEIIKGLALGDIVVTH